MPRYRLLACSATQSIWSSTGFRRRRSSLRHLSSISLAALNLRRLLWVGGPSRHQAPRTGRYKKRVSLLEPLLRDLGNRGDALARSLPSRRSIWGLSFRRERLRERGPSSRRASEGCPPRGGAIEVVFTSEPSRNQCWYPAVQYASGHINFRRTHATVSAPKACGLAATVSAHRKSFSIFSCQYSASGDRKRYSKNTRGQPREADSLSRLYRRMAMPFE